MSSIPEDIILQILPCLPVKSLLRFRSVCSSWLDLIDSPNFIDQHLSQNTRSVSKFILKKQPDWHGDYNLYNFDFNSISQPNPSISQVKFPTRRKPLWWNFYGSTIMSSINGLVCIFNIRFNVISNIFIINPSTRRYQRLPRIPVEEFRRYGFGFDKLNNDYKVVLNVTVPLRNGFKTVVLVYVLRSNLWKTLEFTDNVSFKNHGVFCCGVCVSGSIHWIVYQLNEHRIGVFDLAIEEYRFMLLPECSNTWDEYTWTMDVLKGCLCLSHGYYNYNRKNDESGTNVDVFMMKEYEVVESWTKSYVIELGFGASPIVWPRAISFRGGRRRVLLEVTDCRGLLWYDLENESIEHIKLREEGIVVDYHFYTNLVAISESLVPLSHPRKPTRTSK